MSSPMEDTRSHFFQVIHPATIEAKKLRIPEKFVSKFGDELTSAATLTLPNGCGWRVGLTKEEGKVWFHYDWHWVVEYYSICVGYFVVFKYAKNSNFHVLIFDTTGCEIHYPSRKMHARSPQNQALSSPASARGNTIWKCSVILENSKFKNWSERLGKKCKMDEDEFKDESIDVDEPMRGKRNMNEMYNLHGTLHHKRDLSKHAETLCPHGAPFQDLDIKIDKTNFKATAHNGKDKHPAEDMGNGNELKKATNEVRTQNEAYKSTKIEEDNVLDLLETMGIYIARRYQHLPSEERKRVINIARLFKPRNPSFMVTLTSDSIGNHRVYVPTKFSTKYFRGDIKCVKIQYLDGREQAVKISHCGAGYFLKEGLDEFSSDNNLKEGDICLFELIRTKDVLLKVLVFQSSADISRRKVPPILQSSLPEAPFHFFKIVLHSTLEGKKLRIPPEFVRKFGQELSSTATLSVPNGSLWQVNLTKSGKNIWFHYGLHDLIESHSISMGYFLVFKYKKKSSFHVLIFDLTTCEIDYPCMDEGPKNQEKNLMEDFMEMDRPNDDNEYDLRSALEVMGIFSTEKYEHLSKEKGERALDIAKSLNLKNPSFLIILPPFKKFCRAVYVPAQFTKKFIKKDTKSIKIVVSNGTELSVQICWRRYGGCFLSKKWAEVSMDNNLQAGDICIFELMRKGDVLLKLMVFPSLGD